MEQQEATLSVTPRSAGVRYGLISAVISIAWFLVMALSGLDMQGPASYVGWVVAIVMIILAQKYYKDNGDGFMSYGQGIGVAFWLGLVSAAIGSVFTYIYFKFVDSGMIEAMRDQQIEKMESQGMTDAQIDQAMGIAGMFMNPEMILVMGLIGGIIMTIIFALIVTIFTQKSSPEAAI